MFQRIAQRVKDMGTIKDLCLKAEKHALADQQPAPGAEHFLLSALDLSDGSARRAFGRLNADPAALQDAIARQHSDALRSVGIAPETVAESVAGLKPLSSRQGPYDAAPSGQAVMQALARRNDGGRGPLLGAHVVAVIASMRQGTAARALRTMGVDLDELGAAAAAEIETAFGSKSPQR